MVLVEIPKHVDWGNEESGRIVSAISYDQYLANNITINFYPVTYDQYLNVLGLHLPISVLSLWDIGSKQVSFILYVSGTYMYISLPQIMMTTSL